MYKKIGTLPKKEHKALLSLAKNLEWKINKGPTVDYATNQTKLEAVKKAIPKLFDKEIIKAMFVRIPAGGTIKRHSDNTVGPWKTYHLVLETNPECINISYVDPAQEIHLPKGTYWGFDSWPEHESHNKGKTDRIHLVVNVSE
jgi:aspartyl/asparaginyl beta-hydroxylase (cupin superfamily)